MSVAVKKTPFVLAAAAATLLAGCSTMGAGNGAETQLAEGKCYGLNSCKGQGSCSSASSANACKGLNSCKGQGWLAAIEADCDTKGGRFEPS